MTNTNFLNQRRDTLFKKCKSLGLMYGLSYEDIEDLFQETCVIFLHEEANYSLENLFYTMFKNLCKDYLKAKEALKRTPPVRNRVDYTLVPLVALETIREPLNVREYITKTNQSVVILTETWPKCKLTAEERNLLCLLAQDASTRDIQEFLGLNTSKTLYRIRHLRKKIMPYKDDLLTQLL